MKKVLLASFIILFTLNGCFVYENTYSWKLDSNQYNNQNEYLSFELFRSQRTIPVPFLIVVYSNKKEVYNVAFSFSSNDSIKSIGNFHYILRDVSGNLLLSDTIKDTILPFNESRHQKAFSFNSKKNKIIKGLKEKSVGDSLMLDFEITLFYKEEPLKRKISFKEKKIIKTRTKFFGSFI